MLRARRASLPSEQTKYHPQLEVLEPRMVMTASFSACDALPPVLSHGGGCACPICSGQNLESLFPAEMAETVGSGGSGPAASNPLSSLPQLSSNSGASVKIHLDFNGHYQANWGGYSNCNTRVFDRDGDESTFSDAEIATIQEIWARVAEDYAPFNVDVTTIDPGSFGNGQAVKLAIGGNYSDWFGQAAGGVAYVGGFTNSASNVGYVFEDALGNGTPRYVAEAASHEAGHLFGLLHQSTWVNGQLQDEYNPGNSSWAPIMGVGYYSNRTTWHNGTNDNGPGSYQDDVAILAGGTNGFGLRADDFSSSFNAASNLPVSGSSVNFGGLIGSRTDVDIFLFNTSGGNVSFQMAVGQFGANLDGTLEIRETNGYSQGVTDPMDSLGASLTANLNPGWYFLVVRGNGTFANSSYGNMGRYTITGTVPASAPAPEISVRVGTSEIGDGGTIDFGSTAVGATVDRIVTVQNVGNADLSVSAIASSMPSGFTLVSNLPDGTLSAGQSATFVIRLTAAAPGSFGGDISFTNSDGNEGTYDLHLQGTVTSGGAGGDSGGNTVRILDNGAGGTTLTGSWRLGTRGRDGDVHVGSRASSPTMNYRWNLSNLTPGEYRVYMSWTGDRLNAGNTPVYFTCGAQSLGSNLLNQRITSAGIVAEGTSWAYLRTVTITATTLTARLTNYANGNVVADAVRLERIGPGPSGGALLQAPSAEEASGAGVFVAALSSHSEQTGAEESCVADTKVSPAQRHDELFQQDLDIAPELGLLEETLDLVREVSRHVRGGEHLSERESLPFESLFDAESDWLAVL